MLNLAALDPVDPHDHTPPVPVILYAVLVDSRGVETAVRVGRRLPAVPARHSATGRPERARTHLFASATVLGPVAVRYEIRGTGPL
jgi:hypothetical protein